MTASYSIPASFISFANNPNSNTHNNEDVTEVTSVLTGTVTQSEVEIDPFDGVVAAANNVNTKDKKRAKTKTSKKKKRSKNTIAQPQIPTLRHRGSGDKNQLKACCLCLRYFLIIFFTCLVLAFVAGYIWLIVICARSESWFSVGWFVGIPIVIGLIFVWHAADHYLKSSVVAS